MLRSRAAFTLVELMLAVAIVIILLMVAVPSISGLGAERKLRESFERFDAIARKAQLNAVSQQRAWVLVWQPGAILLQPDEPTPEERLSEGGGSSEELAIGEDEKWSLDRPASLMPPQQTPSEWIFWRSGTCEPVMITYEGPAGWWKAQYHPLTGTGEIIDQEIQ